jgi:hypothetical protein
MKRANPSISLYNHNTFFSESYDDGFADTTTEKFFGTVDCACYVVDFEGFADEDFGFCFIGDEVVYVVVQRRRDVEEGGSGIEYCGNVGFVGYL